MRVNTILCIVGLLIAWGAHAQAAPVEVEGGLVICIGAEALESVSSDWKKPGCVFQCLETSDAKVAELRKKIQAAGCYGKVSVASFDGHRLPYINNLASLVIAGPGFRVSDIELQRIVAPYGSVIAKGKTTTKPYPKAMDEWPQYLHGADNNCVAQDTVVGPPRHVQWISGPAWTRAHIGAATISSMVSSGGRLFTIEDRETAENPLLPAKWKLIARSAFNGVELWTMDYPEWEQITVYIKNFHAQMQRRLVAIGETVYCTPGLTAPLTALDAATGKTIKQFKDTEGTQEFVYHDGLLYAVIGDRMVFNSYKGSSTASKAKSKRGKAKAEVETPKGPLLTFGGKGFPISAYNPQTRNAEKPSCVIAAFDAKTGKEVWRSEKIADYVGCTLALKGDRLVYQSEHGVYCLETKSGKEIWSNEKKITSGPGNQPNSLVLTDDAVYSEEGKNLFAYKLSDGSAYWPKPIGVRKGYQASSDILIAADVLWMMGSCNNAQGIVTKQPTSFDLKTGAELHTIDQYLSKPMGHDRCFRNFITERFFINSKTGGPDCLDLQTDAEYPAPFTRATCSMGHLPCNGLIYCGPYACQCHLPVALHNFNVYYTNEASLSTKGQVIEVKQSVRLEKGSAYAKATADKPADAKATADKPADAPWPTYRQDQRRYSGSAESVPAVGLKPVWETKLKTVATAPVIAEGKLFLAETDAHLLRALDAKTGKSVWTYTAGGRIDSPPTYHNGLLLFGSRDGWVQCLRASDGALAWRFRDLPDQMICVYDQIESAWPVNGSVLIKNDTAYFCAGRSTYLDGGLFIYGLNPATGAVKHQRRFYGPYGENGFPEFVEEGNRSDTEVVKGTTADVMSCEGDTLYIRRLAFNLDLTDATPGKHLIASAGLLESRRQHREYTLVKEDFNHRKLWTTEKMEYPTGDIVVSNGADYYSVFGVPVNRGEPFNPRNGYIMMAKTRSGDEWSSKWNVPIPITAKAMTLAGDTVFLAGAPLVFDDIKDLGGAYAGRRGAVLLATSTADGAKVAEYKLDVLPRWDGMAAAYGKLFIVNQGGGVECWGATAN